MTISLVDLSRTLVGPNSSQRLVLIFEDQNCGSEVSACLEAGLEQDQVHCQELNPDLLTIP